MVQERNNSVGQEVVDQLALKKRPDGKYTANTPEGIQEVNISTVNFQTVVYFKNEEGKIIAHVVPKELVNKRTRAEKTHWDD